MLDKEDEIKFVIIGSGQEEKSIRSLAEKLDVRNVEFIDRFLSEKELSVHVAAADVCLGIFGNTEKAKSVIPCKVYNCLAMRKPIITADTPAMAELLKDGESAALCQPANAHALAEKIMLLRNDKDLRKSIAQKGYEVYANRASTKAIGRSLKEHLGTLC